ncbi:VOC family protein [Mycolicibacterium tokaiense]|uniref:VOC family protein n=1 Tax=Mycolicibacterium tokaiense TaxID=39695 RepID=UPI000E1BC5C6|nr:VOC family protein [Mycolicibacterium tokaiense]
MIGKVRSVVLDCKSPRLLAAFYAELLGGDVQVSDEMWVVLTTPDGVRLAFQLAPEHEPPAFPDRRGSQQFHFDIYVEDVEDAQAKVLALGATRVTDAEEETDFRVFRDPAGHPFCLVFND